MDHTSGGQRAAEAEATAEQRAEWDGRLLRRAQDLAHELGQLALDAGAHRTPVGDRVARATRAAEVELAEAERLPGDAREWPNPFPTKPGGALYDEVYGHLGQIDPGGMGPAPMRSPHEVPRLGQRADVQAPASSLLVTSRDAPPLGATLVHGRTDAPPFAAELAVDRPPHETR